MSFTSGTEASPVTVLSKSLPAGSYLASGKVEVSIGATDPGGEGDVQCALVDVPSGGSPVADVAGFFSTIGAAVPVINIFGAATTLPLEVAVSASSASTLTIDCWVALGFGGENAKKEPGTFLAEASEAHIEAVQTTTNG